MIDFHSDLCSTYALCVVHNNAVFNDNITVKFDRIFAFECKFYILVSDAPSAAAFTHQMNPRSLSSLTMVLCLREPFFSTCFTLVFISCSISFLDAFSHLYKRVCPSVRRSVRPSVGHTRVEFLRNGPL